MEQDPGAIADPGDHSGINTVADPPVEYLPEAIDGLSDTYTPPSPVTEDREIAVADADSLGFSTEFEPPLESLDDYSADSAEQRPSSEVPRDAIDDNPQAQNYTIDKKTGKIFPADKVDLPDKERSSYELNKLSTDQLQAISSLKDGEADPIEVKLLFKTTVLPNGGVEEQYSVQTYQPAGHDKQGRVQFEINSTLLTIVKDPEKTEEDSRATETESFQQESEKSDVEPQEPLEVLPAGTHDTATAPPQSNQSAALANSQKHSARKPSSTTQDTSATTTQKPSATDNSEAESADNHKQTSTRVLGSEARGNRNSVEPDTVGQREGGEATEDSSSQQPKRPVGTSPAGSGTGEGVGGLDPIEPVAKNNLRSTPAEAPKTGLGLSKEWTSAPTDRQSSGKADLTNDIFRPVSERQVNSPQPIYKISFEKSIDEKAPNVHASTSTAPKPLKEHGRRENMTNDTTAPTLSIPQPPAQESLHTHQPAMATNETATLQSSNETPIGATVAPEVITTVISTEETVTISNTYVNNLINPPETAQVITSINSIAAVTSSHEGQQATRTTDIHPPSAHKAAPDSIKIPSETPRTATTIQETPPMNREQTSSSRPDYHDPTPTQPATENPTPQAELRRTPPTQVTTERPATPHVQPNHPYLESPEKDGLSRFMFPLPTAVTTNPDDITLSFTPERRRHQSPSRPGVLTAGVAA